MELRRRTLFRYEFHNLRNVGHFWHDNVYK
jgi:hypothetical protein